VPTSGRGSGARRGVGDDSGIIVRPNASISTTRITDRESVSAAVVERWLLELAFPGADGLQVKFRVVRGLMPSGRNFVLQCARSRSQIVDRMRAPHAVAAKWRMLSRSTDETNAG
jgi:hypothetical protein